MEEDCQTREDDVIFCWKLLPVGFHQFVRTVMSKVLVWFTREVLGIRSVAQWMHGAFRKKISRETPLVLPYEGRDVLSVLGSTTETKFSPSQGETGAGGHPVGEGLQP